MMAAILAVGLMASAGFAPAQQTSKTPSLGDLARELRAERGEKSPKPAKVYTNDNIPRTGALSDVGPTGQSTPGETAATGQTSAGRGHAGGGEPATLPHATTYPPEKIEKVRGAQTK